MLIHFLMAKKTLGTPGSKPIRKWIMLCVVLRMSATAMVCIFLLSSNGLRRTRCHLYWAQASRKSYNQLTINKVQSPKMASSWKTQTQRTLLRKSCCGDWSVKKSSLSAFMSFSELVSFAWVFTAVSGDVRSCQTFSQFTSHSHGFWWTVCGDLYTQHGTTLNSSAPGIYLPCRYGVFLPQLGSYGSQFSMPSFYSTLPNTPFSLQLWWKLSLTFTTSSVAVRLKTTFLWRAWWFK